MLLLLLLRGLCGVVASRLEALQQHISALLLLLALLLEVELLLLLLLLQVVHADHSQLRRTDFVCELRRHLIAYCVAALPMLAAAANPDKAAAAAAAKVSADAAADAAAAAAAKAAAVLQLVEDAVDAALPITRLPCLYALPKDQRRQHLAELRCIVIASLLLQQRRAAAAAAEATAATDEFDWLVPPQQLAAALAAEQQQLLQQQAVEAQDALQRVKNIFSITKAQRETIGKP